MFVPLKFSLAPPLYLPHSFSIIFESFVCRCYSFFSFCKTVARVEGGRFFKFAEVSQDFGNL